jgi:hypothetical protein
MNDIQITSLQALSKVHKTLGARQALVLEYLRNAGPHTNAEIAEGLHIPINGITPRTNELRKKMLVLEGETRRCQITGNTAKTWRAKYPVLPPAFSEKAAGKIDATGIHIHNPTLFP